MQPVKITGAVHSGDGELESVAHLTGDRYLVCYNIDGASWAYEGIYDEAARCMTLGAVVCGNGQLANGMAESIRYDEAAAEYAISFSTAGSPSQIVLVTGAAPTGAAAGSRSPSCTRNRVLGIP